MAITDRQSGADVGSGFVQPESSANTSNPPRYPYNNATETESGHVFEMDDTPSRERIRLSHRSGTFIEMNPDGSEVHKVYGNGYEITVKDKNVTIEGNCTVTIKGDSVVNIEGNKWERVAGNYTLIVDGEMIQTVKGDTSIQCENDMNISAGAGLAGATGALRLYSGDPLYVVGDIMIGGSLNADLITSKTSIDAAAGVTAGPLGFVSVMGGLSVGIPVAIPSVVNAATLVNAPVGTFGLMAATLMTDLINKTIYSTHFHKAPKGFTGTPIFKMI